MTYSPEGREYRGYVLNTSRAPIEPIDKNFLNPEIKRTLLRGDLEAILEPLELFFGEHVKVLDATGEAERIRPVPSKPSVRQKMSFLEKRREDKALQSTDGVYELSDFAIDREGNGFYYTMTYEKKGGTITPVTYKQNLHVGETSPDDGLLRINFDSGKIGTMSLRWDIVKDEKEANGEKPTISIKDEAEALRRVLTEVGYPFTTLFKYRSTLQLSEAKDEYLTVKESRKGIYKMVLDMKKRNDPSLALQQFDRVDSIFSAYVLFELNDKADTLVYLTKQGFISKDDRALLRDKSISTDDYVQLLRDIVSLTPLQTLDDL